MVKITELGEADDLSSKSGLFWGVAMQGGKRYSQKVVTPFHISMAALEPGSAGEEDVGNGYVTVWLGIKGFDYLLCTLKHDSIFNVALDYELDLGEELDLFINGKGTVYLTGYLRLENDPPEDWQDFDGDGEAESVGSDDNMFLDSEDDDDDKEDEEEKEDSDDEIITTQKRRKGKKIIELEDSPPKPKKGKEPPQKQKGKQETKLMQKVKQGQVLTLHEMGQLEKMKANATAKPNNAAKVDETAKVEVVEAPAAATNAKKKKKKKNKNKNKTNDESASAEEPTVAAKKEPAASDAPTPAAEPSEAAAVSVSLADIPSDVSPEEAADRVVEAAPDKATDLAIETAKLEDTATEKKETPQDSQDAPMDTSVGAIVDAGLKNIRQEVDGAREVEKAAEGEEQKQENVVTEAAAENSASEEKVAAENAAGVKLPEEHASAAKVAEESAVEEKVAAESAAAEKVATEKVAAKIVAAEVAADTTTVAEPDSSVVELKEKSSENGGEDLSKSEVPTQSPSEETKSAKKKKKKNKNKSLNESGTDATSKDVNGNVGENGKKRKNDSVVESPVKGGENTPVKKSKLEKEGQQQQTLKLPGGLVVHEQKEGSGEVAKKGAVCMIKYTGRLKSNNKVFDSNAGPHLSPLKMVVGKREVIDGFDEGVEGMKVGGKRRLVIPAHKAYGKQSPSRDIPPNSALIFDVELVKMVGKKK